MDEKKAEVFIKIQEYKEVLDVMELLHHKVKQARVVLRKINELKSQEDAELMEWNNAIDEVERKIQQIDRSLLEPETM